MAVSVKEFFFLFSSLALTGWKEDPLLWTSQQEHMAKAPKETPPSSQRTRKRGPSYIKVWGKKILFFFLFLTQPWRKVSPSDKAAMSGNRERPLPEERALFFFLWGKGLCCPSSGVKSPFLFSFLLLLWLEDMHRTCLGGRINSGRGSSFEDLLLNCVRSSQRLLTWAGCPPPLAQYSPVYSTRSPPSVWLVLSGWWEPSVALTVHRYFSISSLGRFFPWPAVLSSQAFTALHPAVDSSCGVLHDPLGCFLCAALPSTVFSLGNSSHFDILDFPTVSSIQGDPWAVWPPPHCATSANLQGVKWDHLWGLLICSLSLFTLLCYLWNLGKCCFIPHLWLFLVWGRRANPIPATPCFLKTHVRGGIY